MAGAALFFWARGQTTTFSAQGVSFNYPTSYTDNTFLAADGVLASLQKDNPSGTITLALETGADEGARLAKVNILDDLESNLSKSLPRQYSGYQPDQTTRLKIAGYDAMIHDFHYLGAGKTTIYARLIIIPRGHNAYYLTVESPDQHRTAADAALVSSTLRLP